jgi:hypothetical protein
MFLVRDGVFDFSKLGPTGMPGLFLPADEDDGLELAHITGSSLAVMHFDDGEVWRATIEDFTGSAGVSAFDFFGDGTPDLLFAGEHAFDIYSAEGTLLASLPHSSGTGTEYPVIADVDGDGAAEILVVQNEGWFDEAIDHALTVYGSESGNWPPARRIWNQHGYYVENVGDALRVPPNNRLEALKGARRGQYSIRINDQYRICFTWGDSAEQIEVVDFH